MTGSPTLFRLFFFAVAVGAGLGAVYDLFRLRRIACAKTHSYGTPMAAYPLSPALPRTKRRLRPSDLWIFFEDLLFALLAGGTFSALLFAENHGTFRWYAAVGGLLGFAAYRCSIGRAIMRVSDALIAALRRLLRALFLAICAPVLRFFRLLWRKLAGRLHARLARRHTQREMQALSRFYTHFAKESKKL